MAASSNIESVELREGSAEVQRLVETATAGLPQMLDQKAGVFCYTLKQAGNVLVREGVSPRYSAMTVLGLHHLAQNGRSSPVPLEPLIEHLISDAGWITNIGDLGLLYWMCAKTDPGRVAQVEERFPIAKAFAMFPDEMDTMYLAWFLTGVSYCATHLRDAHAGEAAARQAYELLIRNQGRQGFFGHQSVDRGLKGRLRGHIGSFADQVYPIYAFSQFAITFENSDARARAQQCAEGICSAQGSLGQWWWHYDSKAGAVFEKYPVYSVHQHGMAPMALLKLSETSGRNFDRWIYNGLGWITRQNELSVEMEDGTASVIWRCIRPTTLRRYTDAVLRTGGLRTDAPGPLSVLHECRPYELGWLLYALAEFATRPTANDPSPFPQKQA